jgi:hypothetical protein
MAHDSSNLPTCSARRRPPHGAWVLALWFLSIAGSLLLVIEVPATSDAAQIMRGMYLCVLAILTGLMALLALRAREWHPRPEIDQPVTDASSPRGFLSTAGSIAVITFPILAFGIDAPSIWLLAMFALGGVFMMTCTWFQRRLEARAVDSRAPVSARSDRRSRQLHRWAVIRAKGKTRFVTLVCVSWTVVFAVVIVAIFERVTGFSDPDFAVIALLAIGVVAIQSLFVARRLWHLREWNYLRETGGGTQAERDALERKWRGLG